MMNTNWPCLVAEDMAFDSDKSEAVHDHRPNRSPDPGAVLCVALISADAHRHLKRSILHPDSGDSSDRPGLRS
jgi:hypothetical protein